MRLYQIEERVLSLTYHFKKQIVLCLYDHANDKVQRLP